MSSIESFTQRHPTLTEDSVASASTGDTVTLIVSVLSVSATDVKFAHCGRIFRIARTAVVALHDAEAGVMVAGAKPASMTLRADSRIFSQDSVLAKDLAGYVPFAMAVPSAPPTPSDESAKVKEWMMRTGYAAMLGQRGGSDTMSETTHWTISRCGEHGNDDSQSDAGY